MLHEAEVNPVGGGHEVEEGRDKDEEDSVASDEVLCHMMSPHEINQN